MTTLTIDEAATALAANPIPAEPEKVFPDRMPDEPESPNTDKEPPAKEQAKEPAAPDTEEEPLTDIEDIEALPDDELEKTPKEPALPPPQSWSAEDRQVWEKLDPATQAIVQRRENDRDRAVMQAYQHRAQVTKQLTTIAEDLGDWAQEVEQAFGDRWGSITPDMWSHLAAQAPADYIRLKAEFEADTQKRELLQSKQAEAQKAANDAFTAQEFQKLPQVAPELLDDNRRRQVALFLIDAGIPVDRISLASADELRLASLALEGLEARNAKQKAKTVTNTPPAPKQMQTPKPAPRPVAPTASNSPPTKARALQGYEARLTKEKSVDAAVALLLARGKAGR